MGFWKTVVISYNVPGQIKKQTVDMLHYLVKNLSPGSNIIESGCMFGKSTTAILEGLDETKRLDCVDWWDNKYYKTWLKWDSIMGDPIWIEECKELTTKLGFREVWEYHINKHHNSKYIRNVFQHSSLDVPNSDYTMAYLDSAHREEHVTKELNKFQDCEIICGDDYNHNFPGVVNAVKTFVENKDRELEIFDEHNFFIIYK